jgi:Caspase domain
VNRYLVTFSGHGYISENAWGARKQMVVLGSGEEMDFREFRTGAKRAIEICDACREVHKVEKAFLSTRAILMERRAVTAYTREQYRATFEISVMQAPPAVFTMYSCSPGECAGDDPLNGGLFTDALLTSSAQWFETRKASELLIVDEAFNLARPLVWGSRDQQHPVAGADTRTGTRLPFGIRLV